MTPWNPEKKFKDIIFPQRKVVFKANLCLKKSGFHGLIETAEAASAVSMRPWNPFMKWRKPLQKQLLAFN
jgi:hypothetical protein